MHVTVYIVLNKRKKIRNLNTGHSNSLDLWYSNICTPRHSQCVIFKSFCYSTFFLTSLDSRSNKKANCEALNPFFTDLIYDTSNLCQFFFCWIAPQTKRRLNISVKNIWMYASQLKQRICNKWMNRISKWMQKQT